MPTGIGISSGADITSFNPLLADSLYNQEASGLMFQGLIWINGDTSQIDWSRSIASSITTPDNGKTYDVTMRPWVWSDGVKVTTADVAFTFKLIKALGETYVGYGAGGMPDIIQSLNILGPEKFQVVLKRKVNPLWFIYNGLGQLEPLPEHAWAKYSLNQIWQNQSSPKFFRVVDGPLFAQRLDIGQDLVMLPNPLYPGPKLHFTRFVFDFIESEGGSVQGVESGELDMANAPHSLWSAVQHVPGTHIVNLGPSASYNDTVLNLKNPEMAFFRDVRVRQAIADAIDEKEMIALVSHGHGVEIHGPVPPVSPMFLSPEARAGKYPVGYDPAKAEALLAQAGFTRGADGIMQKHGKKLSFTYLMPSGSGLDEQMAEMVQGYLAKIGIQMKVHEIEFNQMEALINDPKSDWQAVGLGQSDGGYPSGEDLFGTHSYANQEGYSDPEMDKLIAESTDEPGLAGLYAYEDYASAQQPVIFMETGVESMLVRNRIQGAQNFIDANYNYYPDALSCKAPGA